MHEIQLNHFLKISRYAGERFDLTQAGGGNSSVQLDDGTMFIKASGSLLSQITETSGYLQVSKPGVLALLRSVQQHEGLSKKEQDTRISNEILNSIITGAGRPSIETFLHTMFYRYTLHTHPIAVNCLTARKTWIEDINQLVDNALYIPYQSPGFSLAVALQKEIDYFTKNNKKKPHICFLQNHGLIVSHDCPKTVLEITETVVAKIEQNCNINLKTYKQTNRISTLINDRAHSQLLSFVVHDPFINSMLREHKEYFAIKPFCPDTLVYCGVHACDLACDPKESIKQYSEKYQQTPKILIFEDQIFLVAKSIDRAKQMEEMLKFHLMILDQNNGVVESLADQEIQYLSHWEAEQYRMNQ